MNDSKCFVCHKTCEQGTFSARLCDSLRLIAVEEILNEYLVIDRPSVTSNNRVIVIRKYV